MASIVDQAEHAKRGPLPGALGVALLLMIATAWAAARMLTREVVLDSQGRPVNAVENANALPTIRLDPNTATEEELLVLPGVAETLARYIVEYREQHGPFESIDELTNVRFIGARTLDRMRLYLELHDASPTP